ncbi:MAG: hypothetical protein K0Q47_133 [Sedimentibacter sp.]|jgi:predicted RNA-binding Zn-ribbon protein involved in translation (DUF1610 family)|nr:hypothetical protein [Sedimentibacter sp.]
MKSSKSYFKLSKQENVFCPKCNKVVYRLSDDKRQDSPKFYICFDCKFIGHIGVGQVT